MIKVHIVSRNTVIAAVPDERNKVDKRKLRLTWRFPQTKKIRNKSPDCVSVNNLSESAAPKIQKMAVETM